MRTLGYFSKSKGVREQKCLGNNVLYENNHCFFFWKPYKTHADFFLMWRRVVYKVKGKQQNSPSTPPVNGYTGTTTVLQDSFKCVKVGRESTWHSVNVLLTGKTSGWGFQAHCCNEAEYRENHASAFEISIACKWPYRSVVLMLFEQYREGKVPANDDPA